MKANLEAEGKELTVHFNQDVGEVGNCHYCEGAGVYSTLHIESITLETGIDVEIGDPIFNSVHEKLCRGLLVGRVVCADVTDEDDLDDPGSGTCAQDFIEDLETAKEIEGIVLE